MFEQVVLMVFLLSYSIFEMDASRSVTISYFGAGSKNYSFAEQRFLIFDVNRGEGFNLRRDVYLRVANTVRTLREYGFDFVLVLPPWWSIWHWKKKEVRIPWGELFDLNSLARYVPVIEFEEFMEGNGKFVNTVLYLQHFPEGWNEAEGFVLKYNIQQCIDAQKYYKKNENKWKGTFFGYGNEFVANDLRCISIQGQSSTLAAAILELFKHSRTLLVDRAETILHDSFGDVNYWRARRSMRYAKHLRTIGDRFRMEKLNSTDEIDGTQLSDRWEDDGRKIDAAKGGPYLCAHLRRNDFLWSHSEDVPSLESAVKQITRNARLLLLKTVFLCTDASYDEVEQLTTLLNEEGINFVRFNQNSELSEAALSIIDQWICAHARFFIGTQHSTFSLRIHEDREILSIDPDTTFNRFCKNDDTSCEQPPKWRLEYE